MVHLQYDVPAPCFTHVFNEATSQVTLTFRIRRITIFHSGTHEYCGQDLLEAFDMLTVIHEPLRHQ